MSPFERIDKKPNPFEGRINTQLKNETPPNTSDTGNVILVDTVGQTNKPSAPRSDEKMYWIKMKKDHIARIGGVIYDLKEGQKVRVSKEVRDILAKSPLGLLDPIID